MSPAKTKKKNTSEKGIFHPFFSLNISLCNQLSKSMHCMKISVN